MWPVWVWRKVRGVPPICMRRALKRARHAATRQAKALLYRLRRHIRGHDLDGRPFSAIAIVPWAMDGGGAVEGQETSTPDRFQTMKWIDAGCTGK